MKKKYKAPFIISIAVLFFCFNNVVSQEVPFQFINIERLSRYSENRVAYQHFEKEFSPFIDNSIALLLIIKDSKVYLIIDGYDDPDVVENLRFEDSQQTTLNPDFWPAKISGKPNFIRITDRRQDLIRSASAEFTEKNYGELFTTMREAFLKRQVAMFRALLMNRRENSVTVERTPIPRKLNDENPVRYKITVKAKGANNVVYYAEDGNGDGITETFTVSLADGFNWGDKTGPNMVNIQGNKQEDIANIIGKLTDYAYNGLPEEEETIRQSFSTEQVKDMIEDVYNSVDPNVKKIEEDAKTK
ncbi:MAG: hypothetical protein FWG13_06770 [Leptospirales bacterium]|nr:hypothetical protein [Leptospirales bacterium]